MIVYRDLKPENLLLDKKGHVRLIDFGFSKKLTSGDMKVMTNCGTPGYAAPEVALLGQRTTAGYDGRAADVWSFGILMCEIIGGYSPFRRQADNNEAWSPSRKSDEYLQTGKNNVLTPQQIVESVLNGDFVLPKGMPLLAKDLVKSILQIDPGMRATLDEIK
jgi:serine/threonine protein kinase